METGPDLLYYHNLSSFPPLYSEQSVLLFMKTRSQVMFNTTTKLPTVLFIGMDNWIAFYDPEQFLK